MTDTLNNVIRGIGAGLLGVTALAATKMDAVSYAETPAAVQSVAVSTLDAQGQDAPPITLPRTDDLPTPGVAVRSAQSAGRNKAKAPLMVATSQTGGLFDAPNTSCAVHFAEAMESGKRVILVFYWPTEAVKASRGVERFSQYDGYTVVPMCLIDPWVGDVLVGQHWDMCQLSAWLYIDGGLTPIETLRQLETN